MMTFALHNRLIGKPGRVKALEKFMEYSPSFLFLRHSYNGPAETLSSLYKT